MHLVTGIGEAHHDKCGKDVWWSDQAVGCCRAETHAVLQDDGKEVGDRVGHGGGEHEDQSEAPDLKIERALEVLGKVELLSHDIVSVLLNARNDEVNFLLVQEALLRLRGLGCELGEVDDEVPSDEADDDCDHTLQDEDPSPSRKTLTEVRNDLGVLLGGAIVVSEPWSSLDAVTLEKREEVAENAGESGRKHADEEEDGVALLEFESLVPAAEEVCRA